MITKIRIRKRRWVVQGRSAVYHVINRVVRKQFWLEEAERDMFLRMMHRQAAFTGIEILSYCLMQNHFHLLIRVPECPMKIDGEHLINDTELLRRYTALYGDHVPVSAMSVEQAEWVLTQGSAEDAEAFRRRILVRMGNLSIFMRELKQRFGIWLNARDKTDGTIWSARFKSVIVEDSPSVLATVAAYIDLNPLRAGIVDDPARYVWSAYSAAMGGCRKARRGLCSLFHFQEERNFAKAIKAYRLILYGKGASSKKGASHSGKDTGRISNERLEAVIQAKGAVSLSEALRCRVQHFSRSIALGSEEFLSDLPSEVEASPLNRETKSCASGEIPNLFAFCKGVA